MNRFLGVIFLVYTLSTYCECSSDCNYAMNVKMTPNDGKWWFPISNFAAATPIGVCESNNINLWYPNATSLMYECAADGNSVVYKLYQDNSECLGSNFTIYSGDNHIRYSDFKCDSSFICPYVQFTQYAPQNWTNPSCDAFSVNPKITNTWLVDECLGNDSVGIQITCTGAATFNVQLYDNIECSGRSIVTDSLQVGCNENSFAPGFVYSKITCHSGTMNMDTTSVKTVDTTLDTTMNTYTSLETNAVVEYTLFFSLVAMVLSGFAILN